MIAGISDWLWGVLTVVILAAGVALSTRTRWVQVTHFFRGLRFSVSPEQGGQGEISAFDALCTSLSATVGTGNIVGVATAVCAGGPGALFWMAAAAFLGMAIKYAEGLLAVKYRVIYPDGQVLGGPFYYIEKGLGMRFRWLAVVFAVCGLIAGTFGIGTVTQMDSILSALCATVSPERATATGWVAAVAVTLLSGVVLKGGGKRIARVSRWLVPLMAGGYVVLAMGVLLCNISRIPGAVKEIVTGAFCPASVMGGAAGITLRSAMQKGVSRGIFSNEAGLGSAPIAAAAASTNDPVRQGLVSMVGTFLDTLVICMMTGLAVVITDAYRQPGLAGFGVTAYAFERGLPFENGVATLLLTLFLVVFAFTSILGWQFYAERCLCYLTRKPKAIPLFRGVYLVMVLAGAGLGTGQVWNLADLCNGLMALPNLVGLTALSGVVKRETAAFTRQKKQERDMKRLTKKGCRS